jgi:hypothetical protein
MQQIVLYLSQLPIHEVSFLCTMQTEIYDPAVSLVSLASPPYLPVETRLPLHLQTALVKLLQIK